MEKVGTNKWIFHGENRRLSIKEIQRIQTFPDWYEFSKAVNFWKKERTISENSRIDKIYKQIGNTVPVLLAQAIYNQFLIFYLSYILN